MFYPWIIAILAECKFDNYVEIPVANSDTDLSPFLGLCKGDKCCEKFSHPFYINSVISLCY